SFHRPWRHGRIGRTYSARTFERSDEWAGAFHIHVQPLGSQMSRNDDFSKGGSRAEYSKVGQVKEVTSLTNPIVKDLRSLALKKFRDQQGVFLAEGLKLVIDALEQDWRIKTLVFAKSGKGNKMVEQVA